MSRYSDRQPVELNPTFWVVRGFNTETEQEIELTHDCRSEASTTLAELLSDSAVIDLTLCKVELIQCYA